MEYNAPQDGQLVTRYENGTALIFRETGWIPLGSCPVRFEGETGWVETGDNGDLVTSAPEMLGGKRPKIAGYPANFHVRNFLDCVKSRQEPYFPAEVGHRCATVCHLGNIAMQTGRKLRWDPVKEEFPDDAGANASAMRLRPMREPWSLEHS